MRSTISFLLILLITFPILAQRVEFEDPDLTFSFKKPKKWELIDDGYVVKVSPSIRDTATVYVSFTYFESPSAIDYSSLEADTDVPVLVPMQSSDEYDDFSESGNPIKIAGEKGSWSEKEITKEGLQLKKRIYGFKKNNQRWKIAVSAPHSSFGSYERLFNRIIKSLKVY